MLKSLLVLGASSDIGCKLIESIHENYEYIIAHYNNNGQAINELVEKYGSKIIPLKVDFLDFDDVLLKAAYISDTYKNIEHIVHLSAPRIKNVKFKKMEWEQYEKDYMIQVRSLFVFLQELLPNMEQRKKGKIVVLLSSCTNNMPPKYWSNYVTNKYALLGMIKSVAVEYIEKGINVNAVSPSMIETKFLEDIPRIMIEKNSELSPMKRNITIQEVTETLIYMLSEATNYMSGQNIILNGGSLY